MSQDLAALALQYASRARKASQALRRCSASQRSQAIQAIADGLRNAAATILEANDTDLESAQSAGLTGAMLDRLRLDETRIRSMAKAMEDIARQEDPVGRILSHSVRTDGLELEKVSVALGTVLFLYESRPNVTTDAAALCLRSGNAVILRGGKESACSNRALSDVVTKAVVEAGLPLDAVQLVRETDRQLVQDLLQQDRYLDVVIPRGGESLIRAVTEASRIPVLKHYKGVCHVYVHPSAQTSMAVEIVYNAKVQRPGVCNAMETLLLDQNLAPETGSDILLRLAQAGVELRGDAAARSTWPKLSWKAAVEADWDEEYLEKILSVAVVSNVEGALEHIALHGSGHTEAIVAEDAEAARIFVEGCDSSSVMINASTRFADGGEYGLGAEIGISTDKLHARGPMGAMELCTYKWIVRGQGQVRT